MYVYVWVCAWVCTCSNKCVRRRRALVIVTAIAQLQLPRHLVLNGARTALSAKIGALEITSVTLLIANHKSISINEQAAATIFNVDTSSPGSSCGMQMQEVCEKIGLVKHDEQRVRVSYRSISR